MQERALKLLRQMYDDDGAGFREGQWEAIAAVVEHRQRVIVVQKTGWGKSLVYFLATRLLRDSGAGCTVLISPLLALMRNQLQAAEKLGLRVATLNSTNPDDHQQIESQILANKIDLVIISPERLGNQRFREAVWNGISRKIGLLVIDEVHCISDWGHDFRPNYRRIMTIIDELSPTTPIIGTTATANDRVVADVQDILGSNLVISRGALTRESLRLFVYPQASIPYRLCVLLHLIKRLEAQGSGIVYCSTTQDCLRVAKWLSDHGISAKPYFSNVEEVINEDREALEDQLLNNQIKVLVASVALGMGFDKPDLSFVIHYQMPGSIVNYYQQIGRAGRAIESAFIILLHGIEDREIQTYFIESSFPKQQHVIDSIDLFRKHRQLGRNDILKELNISVSSADKLLLHLEIEGIIIKDKSDYRFVKDQSIDFARWERIQKQRYDEMAQMEAYANHAGCLMQFMTHALNDNSLQAPCGRCMNCQQWQNQYEPSTESIQEAQTFLRSGDPIRIEPRKQWASKEFAPDGKTKFAHLNQVGYALSYYKDDGWGKLVAEGKKQQGRFSDELVAGSVALIRKYMPEIDWVTAIPSMRYPHLVQDFAQRLADELRLPLYPVIMCVQDRPEQTLMQNSHQQQSNSINAFAIDSRQQFPSTAVLLVDDMIDSGWTFAVLGWMLREQGVKAVYPFALAKVSGKS